MAGNSDSMLIRGLVIGVASADGASTVIGSAFAKMRGGGAVLSLGFRDPTCRMGICQQARRGYDVRQPLRRKCRIPVGADARL